VHPNTLECKADEIGRIAGEGGKVKFSIENASRTRIVLADTYGIFTSRSVPQLIDRNVHILGSVQNIKIARDAVVSLILGSPPGMSPSEISEQR